MSNKYSLLDDPLIQARLVAGGGMRLFTLPGLFIAMQQDSIGDFPALRPHQRHPWHAFLVQLAAITISRCGFPEIPQDEPAWRSAILSLTPDWPDGSAWCLVTPPQCPAFMQPPVPGESPEQWSNRIVAPDALDMLVTSKNHDLKASRMVGSQAEDWLFALISLQTQEGFLGAGNYGISRMNGGFASRPALGAVPKGYWGRRWSRDTTLLLSKRDDIIKQHGLSSDGIALLWPLPWDGNGSISFDALDPFYIEICRRIRLRVSAGKIMAHAASSKVARIEAKALNGQTGDAWTPINVIQSKAVTLGARGFDYKLASELVFGDGTYRRPILQNLQETDGTEGIVILAQGVTRGQGKTEGYHERRIPISPTVRKMFIAQDTDKLAAIAGARVQAIASMRSALWAALVKLFSNGEDSSGADDTKEKASRFARPFEQDEDLRFFDELNSEVEASDWEAARLAWLIRMALRAEATLRRAFYAGPRSGERRYRARAAALSRFHGTLRGPKSPLPELAEYYRNLKQNEDRTHDAA